MPKPTRPSRASMPNRRALGATLAALAIVLAGSATAAGAGWTSYLVRNPAATLVHLNALRRSYGATPVQLVQGWSTGCANHMRYLQRNRVITHGEQRRMPDYTAAGAMAGSTSVLSVPGTEPFPSDQPLGIWAQAPYHQSQVLEPLMRRTGFANGCMNTLRGVQFVATSARARHARPHLVVWPGQNATGVPSSVDACDELPRNPFAAVGWRCNRQGTAFYAYTLDRRRPTCAAGVRGIRAALTAGSTVIPTRVTRGVADCAWIVLTGRPLPTGVQLQLTVRAGGTVVRRSFEAS